MSPEMHAELSAAIPDALTADGRLPSGILVVDDLHLMAEADPNWDPSRPAPAPRKRERFKRMFTGKLSDKQWRQGASVATVIGMSVAVGAVIALSVFFFPLPLLLLIPLAAFAAV